jgi:Protein of unknown function (DUF2997)
MKTITITVAPSGSVSLDTHGFDGITCKDASRFLEKALGTVTRDTPHFDQPASIQGITQARN